MESIGSAVRELKNAVQTKLGNRADYARFVADLLEKDHFSPRCIVDVGCATGTTAKALAEIFPTARVTGCDITDKHVHRNRKAPGNFTFQQIEPFHLERENLKPDMIVLTGVIHHIGHADEDRFLQDIRRSLTDDGIVIVHEHCLASQPFRKRIERVLLDIVEFVINDLAEGMACSYNFFEDARLRALLERNGFEIVEDYSVGGRFTTLPFLNGHMVYYCRKVR